MTFRVNIIIIFLLVILIFFQYRLWWQADGVKDLLSLKKALAQQQQENERLKLNNENLTFQIKRLQDSKDATEYRARNELGMIKKNEMFYQVVK